MTDSTAKGVECPDPECCSACKGRGATLSGPCFDCYGTGHPHPPDVTPPEATEGGA